MVVKKAYDRGGVKNSRTGREGGVKKGGGGGGGGSKIFRAEEVQFGGSVPHCMT